MKRQRIAPESEKNSPPENITGQTRINGNSAANVLSLSLSLVQTHPSRKPHTWKRQREQEQGREVKEELDTCKQVRLQFSFVKQTKLKVADDDDETQNKKKAADAAAI